MGPFVFRQTADTCEYRFAVEKIRVLVANRPRLMRELVVATLADQPDIEIVGETADEKEITEYVDRTRPDYLIIALEQPEVRPGLCGFLLGRYPQMKILAVAPEQNTGFFFWAIVDIRSRKVQSSQDAILNALRNKLELMAVESIQ
jgi:DNA-binding NarL/FixJ family response regulator